MALGTQDGASDGIVARTWATKWGQRVKTIIPKTTFSIEASWDRVYNFFCEILDPDMKAD